MARHPSSWLRSARMLAVVALAAGGALAQTPPVAPPLPPNAMPPPLPAANAASGTATAPVPPAGATAAPAPAHPEYGTDADAEPEVTIIRKDAETVEEIRVNGQLRYVRVTPRGGKTYYLVPSGNGQTFNRMDSLGSGLSVPMWLLFSW